MKKKNSWHRVERRKRGNFMFENPEAEVRKIDIRAKDDYAFRFACKNGHFDIVKYLIQLSERKNSKRTINIQVNNGIPLQHACENGHLDIVKYLLVKGSIINNSILPLSCRNGHLDIVKYLVEEIKIDIYEKDYKTFFYAIKSNNPEIINYLLQIDKENNNKYNFDIIQRLFIYSLQNSCYEISKYLLTFFPTKVLKEIDYPFVRDELENRKKSNVYLILYLFDKRDRVKSYHSIIDINAISLSWNFI